MNSNEQIHGSSSSHFWPLLCQPFILPLQVPADWPYFGAVDFEDVTVRHSPVTLQQGFSGVKHVLDYWIGFFRYGFLWNDLQQNFALICTYCRSSQMILDQSCFGTLFWHSVSDSGSLGCQVLNRFVAVPGRVLFEIDGWKGANLAKCGELGSAIGRCQGSPLNL